MAVRNGCAGSATYCPCRTANTSLVSLARAAGVTWLFSNSRSPIVSTSLLLADMSMMSTRPCSVIWRMLSRYSASVRIRTSPACISGERPGAPMPNAMSASLASARMNSFAPEGRREWRPVCGRAIFPWIGLLPALLEPLEHGVDRLPQHLPAFAQCLRLLSARVRIRASPGRRRRRPPWAPRSTRRACRNSPLCTDDTGRIARRSSAMASITS